jgi:hypothetical protein
MGSYGIDSSGSGQGPMAGFYEHGNGASVSIKSVDCLIS